VPLRAWADSPRGRAAVAIDRLWVAKLESDTCGVSAADLWATRGNSWTGTAGPGWVYVYVEHRVESRGRHRPCAGQTGSSAVGSGSRLVRSSDRSSAPTYERMAHNTFHGTNHHTLSLSQTVFNYLFVDGQIHCYSSK
jgi:hypothetical protein